jgi:hypothetical protein
MVIFLPAMKNSLNYVCMPFRFLRIKLSGLCEKGVYLQ